MPEKLLAFTAFVTVAWIFLVALLSLQESTLIFAPARLVRRTPQDLGLNAQELQIRAADGEILHGWWIRTGSDQTAIWYHGNAGNISHRLPNARRMVDELNIDIVLVDYRGYGLSTGKPDENGLYLDGAAIYDAVTEHGVSPENIILFGRSLGSAVAIETALHRSTGKLVLESAFRSIPALARRHYWFVPDSVIRTRMDNAAKISKIDVPVLLLHGETDRIVPFSHSKRLFELARRPKTFHRIAGAGHNDTWTTGGTAYWNAWRAFLASP